jgi:hypothetical protein
MAFARLLVVTLRERLGDIRLRVHRRGGLGLERSKGGGAAGTQGLEHSHFIGDATLGLHGAHAKAPGSRVEFLPRMTGLGSGLAW